MGRDGRIARASLENTACRWFIDTPDASVVACQTPLLILINYQQILLEFYLYRHALRIMRLLFLFFQSLHFLLLSQLLVSLLFHQ